MHTRNPMIGLTIRAAVASDRPDLRRAFVELQDFERRLTDTRRPGEQIAEAYLDWMQDRAVTSGAILVAEADGIFAGFVCGWIEQESNIAETPDSNRFGYISDICILPPYRRHGIASRLLDAMSNRFRTLGITRCRLNVLAANATARASYEHAGFAPYELTYEKRLDC
jgi:ribosomal protein S18 acetylase RimI-like enzyme